MANTLVLYYSNTGNNKFLAHKMADQLNADIEEIIPRINIFPFTMFSSLFGIASSIKPLKYSISNYSSIICVGPIWAGALLSPLRSVLKMCQKTDTQVFFATCCGTGEDDCDGKFGYQKVFEKAEALLGRPIAKEAFSIKLVVPEDKLQDGDYLMKVRLNDDNFEGKIAEKLKAFVKKIA